MNQERILAWAQQMQAIAQAGLTYTNDPFDAERFEQLRELSVEMVESVMGEEVVSEIVSESVVTPVKLLAALDRMKHPQHTPTMFHCYKFFLGCEILEELGLQENIETDQVGFFAEDELPDLCLARNTKEQIRLMFEHLRDPQRPADCE